MMTNLSGRGVAGILPSSSAKDVGGRRRGLGSTITCAQSRPSTAQISAAVAATVANHPVLRTTPFGGFIGRFPERPSFPRGPAVWCPVLEQIDSFDDTVARAVGRCRLAFRVWQIGGSTSGLTRKDPKVSSPLCQLRGSGSFLVSQVVRVRTYVAVRWAPLR